jgi:16S rRNA (guanine966-N2)-methyltransferase
MRIIAGQYKGRNVLPPPGLTTRPITDRVKTNLFNILQLEIPDAFVLDLFAGTGSIGLEALSRGARHCCFAERDRAALDLLARNIQTFGAQSTSTVWRGDILSQLPQWLDGLPGPVDIGFVDPPYALAEQWDWQQAQQDIFSPLARHLAPTGCVVFRGPRELKVPDELAQLSRSDRRDYGHMSLVFYRPSGP